MWCLINCHNFNVDSQKNKELKVIEDIQLTQQNQEQLPCWLLTREWYEKRKENRLYAPKHPVKKIKKESKYFRQNNHSN